MQATRLLALATLPLAALGSALSGPTARLLFGAQESDVLRATAISIALLIWTVPAYGWQLRASTLLVVTRRPRLAAVPGLLNVGLLALLLAPLTAWGGSPGAALAALLAAAITTAAVTWLLSRFQLPIFGAALLRTGAAAAVAALAVWLLLPLLPPMPVALLWLLLTGVGLLLYAGAAWVLGTFTISDVKALRRTISPQHQTPTGSEPPVLP
jgi:O-antigen/teichoic acid export membrane protein